jgi:hypothetical protein
MTAIVNPAIPGASVGEASHFPVFSGSSQHRQVFADMIGLFVDACIGRYDLREKQRSVRNEPDQVTDVSVGAVHHRRQGYSGQFM